MQKMKPTQWIDPAQVRRLREILTAQAARLIWWEIALERPKSLNYKAACRTCPYVRQSLANRSRCQKRFLTALGQARRSGQPLRFLCPIERNAAILPLSRNSKTHGFLGICYAKRPLSNAQLQLGGLVVEAALRERATAQELKNLSDTLQPRCVALSTIHTIHRLISSTLNLGELLPRVARLCCQVLRAQACTIWLLDQEKQTLEPRAVVSPSRQKSGSVRSIKAGMGMVGKVAASCTSRLTPRMMIVPLVEEECMGVILVRRKTGTKLFSRLDQEILTTLAEQSVVAIRNAQMYETQERITWGTIKSLSAILGGMDTASGQSVPRPQILANIALAIGHQMRLGDDQLRSLEYAALLHDAGRAGIPTSILKKPSKLEPAEFAKIKEHPVKGASLLEPLHILEPAIPIILYHHERYDGTGYPKGLKKEEIPLGARILGVANAFEAMVSERPYRRTLSVQDAAREIARHAGTQFDPKVVKAFLGAVRSKALEGFALALAGRPARSGGK